MSMVDSAGFTFSLLSSNRQLLFFYTDPGTGSLLWQLLLASILGGAFYARLLLRQIKSRFSGLRRSGVAAQGPLGDRSSEAIK